MMVTPSHWPTLGRSFISSTAMNTVQSGLLARMGAAIDIGKCLSANEAKIQELPAITDLRNNIA